MWQYNYDNQTLNYLMHKDHKYISKHKSKNGKWVYLYTEPASDDYSTDIFGKTTHRHVPKTEVYGRNRKQIFTEESTVSMTSTVPFSSGKKVTTRTKYITYGTLEQKYGKYRKKAIKQINSFLNRTANSISRNVSKGKKTVSRLLSRLNNAIPSVKISKRGKDGNYTSLYLHQKKGKNPDKTILLK